MRYLTDILKPTYNISIEDFYGGWFGLEERKQDGGSCFYLLSTIVQQLQLDLWLRVTNWHSYLSLVRCNGS
jgi:hypothetical protein